MQRFRILSIRLRILFTNLVLVIGLLTFAHGYVPDQDRETFWLVAILSVTGAAILTLAVSQSITIPLLSLRRKLKDCQETDKDHVFRDRATDEVGHLYRAVNEYVLYRDNEIASRQTPGPNGFAPKAQEMANRTREMDNLGLLVQFGKTLSLNYDFNDAAHHVLGKVNDHLKLEWSSVLVWDQSSGGMRLAASVGLDPTLSGQILSGSRPVVQFKPGEGISGEVFVSGQPLIINKGYKDKRFRHFPKFTYSARRINTLACVPLLHDGVSLGVANFVNIQEPPLFSDEHVAFLARIAEVLSFLLTKSTQFSEAFRESSSGLFGPLYFDHMMSLEGERVRRRPHNVSLVKLSISFLDPATESQVKSRVFKEIGALIRKSFRRVDLATRVENLFIVYLPGTDSLGALFTAGRLKEQIELLSYDDRDRQLFSASGGLASFPEPVSDWADLSPCADKALEEATRIGDSRVVCWKAGSVQRHDSPSPPLTALDA